MRNENRQNLYFKVEVNQEEIDIIKRKLHNSEMDTFSGSVRAIDTRFPLSIFDMIYIHIFSPCIYFSDFNLQCRKFPFNLLTNGKKL